MVTLPMLTGDGVYGRLSIVRCLSTTASQMHVSSISINGVNFVKEDPTGCAVTFSLLLTCRVINEDVSAVVYSTNTFYVDYGKRHNLQALCQLRPSTIRVLRHLVLHLNVVPCGFCPGHSCEIAHGPWHDRHWSHDAKRWEHRTIKPSFHASEPVAQQAIAQWQQLWRDHLGPNLAAPGQLDFSLICDSNSANTARLVAQPLLERPSPCLVKCRIRLGHRRDVDLQRLARQAVESVVASDHLLPHASHDSNAASFRFLDLPTEIRQHILQYTDLVTRWNEVEWNPKDALYYSRHKHINLRKEWEVPDSQFGEENVARNRECWRPEHLSSWFCFKQSRHHGCFCSSYHSAYSNVVHCKCWAPPTALFLVCRVMRQDAMQVFFSRNRFVVAPECVDATKIGVVGASPSRLPASRFLSLVVPRDALRHLRFLDIYFPAFGDEFPVAYCPNGSPEQLDWIQTLNSAKDSLSLPNLTIRVTFASHPDPPHLLSDYRWNITQQQRWAIKTCYVTTIAPLRLLKGLGRFFAHLAGIPRFPDSDDPNRCVGGQNDTALEGRVERLVMGERYHAAGKAELGQSILAWRDASLD